MKTTLEEPTIVAPEKVIDADAPPKGDLATMELSGNEFETKLAAAEAKAAAEKAEPPAKDDPPKPKKDEPAKKDDPGKGKTPLDTAPAAEKKDEPPALEEELKTLIASEPPPNASASSKANHAAMRKGLERANSTITELRTKLDESKKAVPAAVPAEVEERLKAAEVAVKEREALLERVAFERSPRFQKFITEGEAELTSAKSYLEGSEINPSVIDVAARTAGAKRVALLTESGMDASTIAAVTSHLARNDAIARDREAALENHKATQAEWNAEQAKASETRAATIKANEDKVFAEVGKKVAETYAPFQKTNGENAEWDSSVDGRIAEAQEYFDGKKTLPETAEIIYAGQACKVYKDAFEDLRTKYNDLVAENDRTKAARPGAAATSHDDVTINPKADPMALAGDTFEANAARRGA